LTMVLVLVTVLMTMLMTVLMTVLLLDALMWQCRWLCWRLNWWGSIVRVTCSDPCPLPYKNGEIMKYRKNSWKQADNRNVIGNRIQPFTLKAKTHDELCKKYLFVPILDRLNSYSETLFVNQVLACTCRCSNFTEQNSLWLTCSGSSCRRSFCVSTNRHSSVKITKGSSLHLHSKKWQECKQGRGGNFFCVVQQANEHSFLASRGTIEPLKKWKTATID
jgi:hypothetical protein